MKKWKDKELIGQGGNGKVYKISHNNGKPYALKILSRFKQVKAYKRFKDEIKILKELRGTNGIIELIEYYLPKELSNSNRPYYIMPLGIPIKKFIKYKTHTQFYALIIKLAQTLVELHERGITHRDIKPENILIVDGEPVFSDFGLAHFPDKQRVSNKNERIGPAWTIAPEMKRISSTAQYKKADIYSFAKTLWILITGQNQGFEGQYVPKSSISIDNYVSLKINDSKTLIGEWRYESLVLLEKLFEDSTSHEPLERPDANLFLERLTDWYNTSTFFEKRNIYEWEHCIRSIFPFSIPETSSWKNREDIYNVLKSICCEYDQLNYAFFPEFGGSDLTKVEIIEESNLLCLNSIYVFEPERLTFESMNESEFSYFYLKIKDSSPNVTNILDSCREIIELDGSKNGQLTNFFNGSFVIVRKTSFLNRVRGKLDGHFGLHHEKPYADYKNLVGQIQKTYNAVKLKKNSLETWLAG